MDSPETPACRPAKPASPHHGFTRLAAVVLSSLLPIGLISCANHQAGSPPGMAAHGQPDGQRRAHGQRRGGKPRHPAPTPGPKTQCGSFIAPTHDVIKSMSANSTVPVPITVRWTTSGGCTFGGGKVTVFLVKAGTSQHQYCGTLALPAQGPTDPNFKTVTFSFCVGNSTSGASTGTHFVRCYTTGVLSDGTTMTPFPHLHGTTGHCH